MSLFCGACSIEAKIAPSFNRVICNDKHPYLISLWHDVQNRRDLPEIITEEEYKYVRAHKDEDPALTGFVGFGCSFGGRFFQGYAHGKSRSYAAEAKRGLEKKIQTLHNAEFLNLDYRDVPLPDGCIIYADPPYAGTKGYGFEMFDTNAFWQYMREISKKHMVFISEQNAPEDFVSIWSKPLRRIMDVNKENNFFVIENLFVWKEGIANGARR